MQKGGGYLGSSSIQTSVANQEIISTPPSGWPTKYYLYKFSLYNDQACTIKINNGDPIYIRAGQGFNMDQGDKNITSLCICENGITYSWIGAF